MKITKRIAEEAYCYTELEFDSLEEYKTEYPNFAKTMVEVKKQIMAENQEPPFEDKPKAWGNPTGEKIEQIKE